MSSPGFLCIQGSTSANSTNALIIEYSSIYCWKKNPNISGPVQFKHMLFKSQIYTHILDIK